MNQSDNRIDNVSVYVGGYKTVSSSSLMEKYVYDRMTFLYMFNNHSILPQMETVG